MTQATSWVRFMILRYLPCKKYFCNNCFVVTTSNIVIKSTINSINLKMQYIEHFSDSVIVILDKHIQTKT